MIVERVKLKNFRSHGEYTLEFRKRTTMIAGENGCGKTSILEAVYEAMQGRSFRAVDREIVKEGEKFYRIELEYGSGEKMVVKYDAEAKTKEFLCGGKVMKRLGAKYKYPVVLFEPSDLGIVEASPARKRDYFDRLISQMSGSYNNFLLKFKKALKQRNELLKEEYLKEEALFAWDILLARYGTAISGVRRRVVEGISGKLTGEYRAIAGHGDEVGLRYVSEVGSEQEYLRALGESYRRDRAVGHTTFGAQKDDYEFLFNGNLAEGRASRGETRSIVIALKFIEAETLAEVLGKKPLVLLDDVFSELDETRQKALARNFKENQVIITSVEGA